MWNRIKLYAITFLASSSCVLGTITTQPNLLFILTDDQRDNSFSGMGHPWVETPNIDKLLEHGVRFENALPEPESSR